MAEHSFQEVMRQWRRMCVAFKEGCERCPQYCEYQCYNTVKRVFEHGDIESLESNVMSWAAENPEPVYPTWREWLIKRGLIDFKVDFKSLSYSPYLALQGSPVIECLNAKASEPIPADIAQKLGIELKGE